MKTLSFAVLILSFGLVVQADFTEFFEVIQELGNGQCSQSRFSQLMQELTTCQEEIDIITTENICSSMGIKMNCIDNTLSECWTPQGLKKFKAAALRLVLQVTSSEQTEELKSCPTIVEILGKR